jgi:hypothetical protein
MLTDDTHKITFCGSRNAISTKACISCYSVEILDSSANSSIWKYTPIDAPKTKIVRACAVVENVQPSAMNSASEGISKDSADQR